MPREGLLFSKIGVTYGIPEGSRASVIRIKSLPKDLMSTILV